MLPFVEVYIELNVTYGETVALGAVVDNTRRGSFNVWLIVMH